MQPTFHKHKNLRTIYSLVPNTSLTQHKANGLRKAGGDKALNISLGYCLGRRDSGVENFGRVWDGMSSGLGPSKEVSGSLQKGIGAL